ncbi:amino acid kinase [Lithospermum erythrorhizon]|uniref:Amino acid kinase n=1 Tax=Lithospermum erythrorhizon TaxID=34254 RepID=A0AAV3PBH3_LITER
MSASTHLVCSHHLYGSSFKKGRVSSQLSYKPNGSFSFKSKPQIKRTQFIKAMVSDSSIGNRQVEIVYDPEGRLNQLADEVDKNADLSRLTLFSPCKVNVFLRITGKREDGYHDLASLFHVISLGDKIKFSLSPSKSKDRLSTNVPGIPLCENNLIIKALNLYREKTGTDNYFWVHIDKRVPTGAGLGGGSSNAATALWAANQFSSCIAGEKDLQKWSGEIGSDVPFFFSHGAAYCTGRGEVVEDLPSPIPSSVPMVLIKPQEACSTAEVYKLHQTSKIDPLTLLANISRAGISQDVCVNDLAFAVMKLRNAELPAFEVLPSLKRLKQRIISAGRGQYDAVFMSGSNNHLLMSLASGSTIVGIGSPDPPQFIYDDEEYKDVFLSEARFITRAQGQWYSETVSADENCSTEQSQLFHKDIREDYTVYSVEHPWIGTLCIFRMKVGAKGNRVYTYNRSI